MKNLFKFLFAITIGALYGILFAQRPGKELRKELKDSETPLKVLFEEGMKVDKEACRFLTQWAKNSEELQKVMAVGKKQIDNFVLEAKNLSAEGKEVACQKLEELAKNAKKAAEDLKFMAVDKVEEFKKGNKK